MTTFVCVIHPIPSAEFTASMAPGYGLSRAQLAGCVPMLFNLPVTVEHNGIYDAITQLADRVPLPGDVESSLNRLAEKDSKNAIVGRVVDAWQTTSGALYGAYQIDPDLTGVRHLVESGMVMGVSLTHMMSPNEAKGDAIVPYELTLCGEPARSGAYTFLADQLVAIQQYKRELLTGRRRDIASPGFHPTRIMTVEQKDAEMADAAKTPIEAAFDSISDEQTRSVIANRLTEMVKKLDAEQAARKAAESRVEDITRASKVNEDMLKTQLGLFQQQLGEDLCKSYCLDDANTHGAIDSAKENPNALLQVFDRAMIAASKKFLQNADGGASRKRKAEPLSPEVVQATESVVAEPVIAASAPAAAAAAAPVTEASSPSDLLRRAMAASFDC